jgi:hypothetical protein
MGLVDEKLGGSIHLALGLGCPNTGTRNKRSIHWDLVTDFSKDAEIALGGDVVCKDGGFVVWRELSFPPPSMYESVALVKDPPWQGQRVIRRDRAGLTGNIYPAQSAGQVRRQCGMSVFNRGVAINPRFEGQLACLKDAHALSWPKTGSEQVGGGRIDQSAMDARPAYCGWGE